MKLCFVWCFFSPFPTVAESIQKELDEYRASEEEVKRLKNVMVGFKDVCAYLPHPYCAHNSCHNVTPHHASGMRTEESFLQHIGLVAVVFTCQRFNSHRCLVTPFFLYKDRFLLLSILSIFRKIPKKSDHEKI